MKRNGNEVLERIRLAACGYLGAGVTEMEKAIAELKAAAVEAGDFLERERRERANQAVSKVGRRGERCEESEADRVVADILDQPEPFEPEEEDNA